MMSLSQSTGYAISALTCIAEQGENAILIRDIAKLANVPAPYLAKLIAKLAAAGLVESKRGLHGGVRVARNPASISVLDVAQAIDGVTALGECLLGLPLCSSNNACPAHGVWGGIRSQIENLLREMTLADVVRCKTGPPQPTSSKSARAQKPGQSLSVTEKTKP